MKDGESAKINKMQALFRKTANFAGGHCSSLSLGLLIEYVASEKKIIILIPTQIQLDKSPQVPSWKIMDSKGRITVVLHWEKDPGAGLAALGHSASGMPSRQGSICSTIASGGPRQLLGVHTRSISQVRRRIKFNVLHCCTFAA